MVENKEEKSKAEDKLLEDVIKLEAQLKQALEDKKEAQLQREFLRDPERARIIICPICRHAKVSDVTVICPTYKTNRNECRWIKAITQVIPVKSGQVVKEMEYANPNLKVNAVNEP